MKMKLLAAAAVACAMIAPAQAQTINLGGSVAPVCAVTVSNQSFNLNTRALQRVADLAIKCNSAQNPTFRVTATNGQLLNSVNSVDYEVGFDLNGSTNAVQYPATNLAASGSISALLFGGQELSTNVPGNISVRLLSEPWAAGSYSETFTLSIG